MGLSADSHGCHWFCFKIVDYHKFLDVSITDKQWIIYLDINLSDGNKHFVFILHTPGQK